MQKLNLHTAPAAITPTSAAVVWDKIKGVPSYKVYVAGKYVSEIGHCHYTAENLAPQTEYEIRVSAGSISESVCVTTRAAGRVLDICDYGAVGDGATVNTRAIQRAIDECGAGDTVLIPDGVFISGALYLKSDMTLRLTDGAVLKASADIRDYPIRRYRFEGLETDCYSSFINTTFDTDERLKNITIEGRGRIDAGGDKLFSQEINTAPKRGRAVCMRSVDGLYIKDVTVKNSPAWCVHAIYCTDVTINGVKIHTAYDETRDKPYTGIFNGDGFDPDSCRNVYVFGSTIASQDDCIAIKSGRDAEGRAVGKRAENIRITDCRFENGFGVAVGSESSGDVRNVLVRDCTYSGVYSVVSIKSPRGRGGVIENIVCEDLRGEYGREEFGDCQWFRGGVYIDNFYSVIKFDPTAPKPVTVGTPKIRNITMRNITMRNMRSNAIFLAGLPESPLENITLENVECCGNYGMKAYNVKGLAMREVRVSAECGEEYEFVNVKINK